MRSDSGAMRRKLRARGGLTLIEMLVTVLLVAIVSGVTTVSVQLMLQNYRQRTRDSDAQLLCSALSLFVQNELTYAGDIHLSGETLTFTDHARNLGQNCFFDVDEDGRLILNCGGGVYEAVGRGTYGKTNKQLKADCQIAYAAGRANVTLRVLTKDGIELSKTEFVVRPIAPGNAA